MIGKSPQLLELLVELRRFAGCDAPVLIEGETGTGKELAARELHYAGVRAGGPFVPVNCGAIPDALVESEFFGHRRGAFTDAKTDHAGLVELARGGSLFLDEVDSLSPKAQVTLLRFLQDSEYRPVGGGHARAADVRVIAATNSQLVELVRRGEFRSDLLYRLNPLYIRVPPLRERIGDVEELAQHFLRSAAKQLASPAKRWHPLALQLLSGHAWLGNVRELESVVMRACLQASADEVGPADLTAALRGVPAHAASAPLLPADPQVACFALAKSRAIALFEHDYLTALMRRAHGNVSEAARLSKTERRQLGKLLKKRGIEPVQFGHG
ncbi:MAG: sigma-54-dependent Fis family transcriptional regulator [Proteobacteria bacterium]|nr:sigma-54-dependent Fis family transcriptional regulator [Pseudomonadota bacterium]